MENNTKNSAVKLKNDNLTGNFENDVGIDQSIDFDARCGIPGKRQEEGRDQGAKSLLLP